MIDKVSGLFAPNRHREICQTAQAVATV